MDLSHDGTIVTCVQAGHTLFNCYLFKALSPDGLGAKLTCFPPTLEWWANSEASPQEILAFAIATITSSPPTRVMISSSHIYTYKIYEQCCTVYIYVLQSSQTLLLDDYYYGDLYHITARLLVLYCSYISFGSSFGGVLFYFIS